MTDNILSKELCFQLYIASRNHKKILILILNRYSLTYTGFIAMLAIENKMTINNLGEELSLDSGTLSPLLKRLEAKGYIVRNVLIKMKEVLSYFSQIREHKLKRNYLLSLLKLVTV